VTILTNLPYNEVCNYLRTSLIGIHTMKDEHFGISNIEFMVFFFFFFFLNIKKKKVKY